MKHRQFFPMLVMGCVMRLGMVPYASSAEDSDGFVPLFDGKTANGWFKPFDWGEAWVQNDEIHLKGDPKFFLVSERTFGDFILEAEVNVPVGGNSGIQFRSQYQQNRVWGYQAEVDTSDRKWAGGLYDEARRAWLNPLKDQPERQAAFKNGEWNHYKIEAIGDRIRIWVNGVLTTDYRDSLDTEGHIALQHHGEKGLTYRFRNIRIKDLGKRRWEPIYDETSLAGWHALPGGNWTVENGAFIGTSSAGETRHGLLVSDKRYGDFTVRFKFKVVRGNSGFYFRIKEDEREAHAFGFQAEVCDTFETGGLYETYGRAWVAQVNQEEVKKHYTPGEWTDMTISAHGGWLVVYVNGFKTAELKDDPGLHEGHFALQLHGGQEMHVEFKDLAILGEAKH